MDLSPMEIESAEREAWADMFTVLPLALADKQALLELTDPLERLAALEPAVTRNRD